MLWTLHVHTSSSPPLPFSPASLQVILDIRVPSLPIARLSAHAAPLNALAWAPHSPCHICTAGDDSQALIWDVSQMPKPIEGTNGGRRDRAKGGGCLLVRMRSGRCLRFSPFAVGSCSGSDTWLVGRHGTRILIFLRCPCDGSEPILAYVAEAEINQLQWSKAHTDWIAIALGNKLQVLRV